MTNITAMMERRAEIAAELDAIPEDLAHEQEFKDRLRSQVGRRGNSPVV